MEITSGTELEKLWDEFSKYISFIWEDWAETATIKSALRPAFSMFYLRLYKVLVYICIYCWLIYAPNNLYWLHYYKS
jgi:hypothetical protein